MRRVPLQYRNSPVRREPDRRALRRQLIMLACGVLLAGGFVVAAGQHFVAVQYGYRGEDLRRERERLLAERQQLLLELDNATSPASLDRAARAIGMQPARPGQVAPARARAVGAEAAERARSAALPAESRRRKR